MTDLDPVVRYLIVAIPTFQPKRIPEWVERLSYGTHDEQRVVDAIRAGIDDGWLIKRSATASHPRTLRLTRAGQALRAELVPAPEPARKPRRGQWTPRR